MPACVMQRGSECYSPGFANAFPNAPYFSLPQDLAFVHIARRYRIPRYMVFIGLTPCTNRARSDKFDLDRLTIV